MKNGFIYCSPGLHNKKCSTEIIEGFSLIPGIGKFKSSIYKESCTCVVYFSNGKTHVLKKQYIEFHHDIVNKTDDITKIDWHWVDYPTYYEDDVKIIEEVEV